MAMVVEMAQSLLVTKRSQVAMARMTSLMVMAVKGTILDMDSQNPSLDQVVDALILVVMAADQRDKKNTAPMACPTPTKVKKISPS